MDDDDADETPEFLLCDQCGTLVLAGLLLAGICPDCQDDDE